jgi:hypothetical protein
MISASLFQEESLKKCSEKDAEEVEKGEGLTSAH